MKNRIQLLLTLVLLTSSFILLHSQVAINPDNSEPDPSAMLDVSSTEKGMLVPRMTTVQRETISSPATGLLVFDSTTESFWYYTDAWQEIGSAFVSENGITNSKNNDDDFVFGADSLNYGNGRESKFLFDKEKGAFRAGLVNDIFWDSSNRGAYSAAFGENTVASGLCSFAFGFESEAQGYGALAGGLFSIASGEAAFTFGIGNTASSNYSIALGRYNTASGNSAVALGRDNLASGSYTTALGRSSDAVAPYAATIGYNLKAVSYAEIAVGAFNTTYAPVDSNNFDVNDRLFVIGNGTDDANRSDAIVVYKSGNTSINGALTIDSAYTFPLIDGTDDQILTTDGNGALSWVEQTDAQELSLTDDSLTITNGNSIDLSEYKTIGNAGLVLVTDELEYILDVQQTTQTGSFGSVSNAWQSFTPTASGHLTQVDLSFGTVSSFNEGLLSFYEGQGTDGTLISTFDVYDLITGFNSFDLSDNPLPITANEVYTLRFQATSGNFFMPQASGDLYSGGRANRGANIDLLFRTYYSPTFNDTTNIITFNETAAGSASFTMGLIDTLFFSNGSTQTSGSPFLLSNGTITAYDNSADLVLDGNVGIGVSNPTNAALEVDVNSSTNSFSLTDIGFLNSSGANTGTYDGRFGIYTDGRVGAFAFIAHSDERIKNIIGTSDGRSDLEILNQIEVTDYTMKDEWHHGSKIFKKVIAQQVAEIYPQAVAKNITEVVPDIFQKAAVEKGWISLATDLKVGEKVKIITKNSNDLHEVTAVEADRFQVSNLSSNISNLFVYGREVNDFHTVDYEAISMLNVSATQELAKENNTLKERVTELEAQIYQLEAMFQQLHAQLNQ